MELIWIYAWASFIMTAVIGRTFPLSSAIFAFGLALLLTTLSRGRGWRWVQMIGIQVLGMALMCIWTLYLAEKPSLSLLDGTWIIDYLSGPKTVLQWAALSISLFGVLCFWIGGIGLSIRPNTYAAISNCFDRGAGALLFLLLIELVILFKGGSVPGGGLTPGGLFSFFIFSVLAFSLSRTRGDGQKNAISGYQGISAVVSFATIILLLSTALVSFLLPHLTQAAQAGYRVLTILAQPVGHVIISILKFIFTHNKLRSDPSSNSQSPLSTAATGSGAEGGWIDSVMAILGWVLLGIGIVAALLVVSFLLWRLLKLLLTRTTVQRRQPDAWRKLIIWILKLPRVLFEWMAWIGSRIRGHQSAVTLYLALLVWGRRSGISPMPSDTPLEYGLRLRKKFPSMEKEIQTIIATHNTTVYGQMPDTAEKLSRAKTALVRLRRPGLWPARLRSCLFPTDG